MATRLATKTALASLAAVGLFLPFGAPLPGSCLRTIGVAGAAPSPSCAGDLRECLRASADMHQTTFGGRYVTADDVARCMEAFRACTSGGASRDGNSPTSTSPVGGGVGEALPQGVRIRFDTTAIDCRINGDTASCTQTREEPLANGGHYSLAGQISGVASGLTITGTFSGHSTSGGHSSGCVSEQDHSGPVRYDFSPDGSVAMRLGPNKVDTVFAGTCSNSPPMSETGPVWEGIGTWSPTG